jgi:predicted nucleotidyltransferase
MMNKGQQPLNKNQHFPGNRRGDGRDSGSPRERKSETSVLPNLFHYSIPHQELFRRSSLILIAALGRNYPNKFHVRELARITGYDASMVSKNLKELEEANLVTHEEVGNLVLYQADIKSVLLRQLKICLTLLDLTDLLRNLDPFTTGCILYGSCARGEDTDESDIDLFIETLDKEDVSRILGEAQQKIARNLSPIIQIPDETYRLKSENTTLFNNIQRGIVLKG